MAKISVGAIDNLMILKHVDMKAQSDYKLSEKTQELEGFEKMSKVVIANKDPLTIKELAVTGSDLIQMGIPQGKELGEKLGELLELVLEEPEINNREELLKRVVIE